MTPQRFDPITDQTDPRIASLRYGRFRRPVSRVGCGPVAICNVMRYIGIPEPFVYVLSDAQRLRLPWLFGLFGTKPWAIKRYFRQKHVPFESTRDLRRFLELLPQCRAAIVCTWNNRRRDGIHYYTVIKDKDGCFSSLNRVCGVKLPVRFFPQAIRKDRFIIGFVFP